MNVLKLPEGKAVCRDCIYCLETYKCRLRPLSQDYITGHITFESCHNLNEDGECSKFEKGVM